MLLQMYASYLLDNPSNEISNTQFPQDFGLV